MVQYLQLAGRLTVQSGADQETRFAAIIGFPASVRRATPYTPVHNFLITRESGLLFGCFQIAHFGLSSTIGRNALLLSLCFDPPPMATPRK